MYGKYRKYIKYRIEKWFPLQGERAYFFPCIFLHARLGERTTDVSIYPSYNILHRLQVHHLTLTFIIHNKYISTLYLHIYILIVLITTPFLKMYTNWRASEASETLSGLFN